jgi:tetratricopeptide (TPR) repeat protein
MPMLWTRRGRAVVLGLAIPVAIAALLPPARAGKAGEIRKQAFQNINEGVAAYNRAEYPEAVEKLQAAAAVALNSFRAHLYLGQALTAVRRFPEAIEALDVALDLEPDDLGAHVARANALLGRGDLDEAAAGYTRAMGLRPDYAPALDGLARVAEARGEDAQAIATYERAIASNKGYPDPYMHLGDLYLRSGRLDQAVQLLREAVRVRPDFGPGLNRLASAYARLGLFNEAVATIRRAIELEPRVADHRATLGQIQLELGLLGQAEQSLQEALDRDPALPAAFEGLSEASRRRGDYLEAVARLDRALALPHLDERARERLLERRAALEAEQVTVARLEATIASGAASADDLRALATFEAGRTRWERAADLQAQSAPEGVERERLAYYDLRASRFREAHAIYSAIPDAGRPDLAVNDGIALTGLGDHEAAEDRFRRALALDANFAVARLYLGNTLLRQGRTAEAADAYVAFLAVDPNGERAERVRRVLQRIAPEKAPPPPNLPIAPTTPPPPAAAEKAS